MIDDAKDQETCDALAEATAQEFLNDELSEREYENRRSPVDDPTGGPAFPSEQTLNIDGLWNQTGKEGMTLRDWFAGMSLANIVTWTTKAEGGDRDELERLANCAYQMADAMIAERKRGSLRRRAGIRTG